MIGVDSSGLAEIFATQAQAKGHGGEVCKRRASWSESIPGMRASRTNDKPPVSGRPRSSRTSLASFAGRASALFGGTGNIKLAASCFVPVGLPQAEQPQGDDLMYARCRLYAVEDFEDQMPKADSVVSMESMCFMLIFRNLAEFDQNVKRKWAEIKFM